MGTTAVGRRQRTAARHLGYQVVAQTIGEGRRIRPQPDADDRWIAQPSMRDRNRALYIDGVRPVSRGVQSLTRWQEAETGSMGIAVLVRPELPIEASRVLSLRRLKADRMRRAAIVLDVTVDDRPISVGGIHMSHLLYGSPRHFAELRRRLRTEARPDAVLAGDMNSWGPPVRFFMPRLAARGDRPQLAHLAPPQPDRPHPRARRRAPPRRRRLPPLRFRPSADTGRIGDRIGTICCLTARPFFPRCPRLRLSLGPI